MISFVVLKLERSPLLFGVFMLSFEIDGSVFRESLLASSFMGIKFC